MAVRAVTLSGGEKNEITIDQISSNRDKFKLITISPMNRTEIDQTGSAVGVEPPVLEGIHKKNMDISVNEYERYSFIAANVPHYDKNVKVHVVYMFLGGDFLVCITDYDDVITRLWKVVEGSRIKSKDHEPGHLLVILLDCVVDEFYPAVNSVANEIQNAEGKVLKNPTANIMPDILNLRSDLFELRQAIWPNKNVLSLLEKGMSKWVSRDMITTSNLLTHQSDVIGAIQSYEQTVDSLVNIYASSQSLELNKIVKQLTIITFITAPVTVVTSYYGMNFKNMPMIEWSYGYYIIFALILILFVSAIAYLYVKGWVTFGKPKK